MVKIKMVINIRNGLASRTHGWLPPSSSGFGGSRSRRPALHCPVTLGAVAMGKNLHITKSKL